MKLRALAYRGVLIAPLVVVGFSLGCGDSTKVQTSPAPERPEPEVKPDPLDLIPDCSAETWIDAAQLPWDAWYIQYEGGKRTGYSHVRVSKGNSLVVIKRDSLHEIESDDAPIQYKVSMEAFETVNGRFAGFTEETKAGEYTSKVKAELARDQLTVRTTDQEGKTTTAKLTWDEGTWGILELQALLFARPMQPGEQRKANVFAAKLKKTVPVILTAGNREYTALGMGTPKELLPVTVEMKNEEDVFRSRHWTNDRGEILKSVTLGGRLQSRFRAPPEVAMQIADEYRLKTMLDRQAEFSGDAPTREDRIATFRVESTNFNIFSLWASNVRQQVKSLTALSARVRVNDVSDPESIAAVKADTPLAECLEASDLIPSDHPTIADLATKLSKGASTDSEIVSKLTQSVAQLFKATVFSASVNSPVDTVRNMYGNTTELSMLLTSLLRNRGIPARLASGIRIDRTKGACVFHMWTEAWLDDRWLPVDPITGSVTGIDCLKMSDSAMKAANPYDAILPVFERLNMIRVRRISDDASADGLLIN